ncbi:bifunctional folylpolyglutamate synthase/dihydrofolate synthase [Parablautia muri]|uniref:tetrahydrofolate synthase n=1 Tax=Parablautia muri TaxID=2320879 RepID=A0A9X5BHC2_9FIRM|nr:folylpolyglutamate synthase/dihydrofolate synthase family protein [Parablautia muri]NBJ92962.1 bifunctional folylpolyglutamate synthase/dihydrofolate synthase [Parablautia muri]
MKTYTYSETEQYILEIPGFAGKHTLEETKKLLRKAVGDKIPGKVIHIAGTNGKGSVCAYLSSILLESGLSVGMFLSPHLETMRERICIGNEMISEEEFVDVFCRIKEIVDEDNHPSFFEFLFLMAMAYFKEKEPDYIILETGMGGRLDATNAIEKPALCIITEIGYDHMQYLGNTIEAITAEKAGIIKAGVPVIFFDKRQKCTEILTQYVKKARSSAFFIGNNNILDVNINNKSIDFSLETGYYNYVSLSLNTTAPYQTENAALAVCAAERLENTKVTPQSIEKGLWAMYWPGRMEEVLPGIYLDGAHNEDGIEAFLHAVRCDSCQGKRLLLFGVVADKRYEAMAFQIAESQLFGEVALTCLETDRSASIDRLKTVWKQYGSLHCSFHESAKEAYRQLISCKEAEDVIYIAGSLYLVGQMKSLIGKADYDSDETIVQMNNG